MRKYIITALLCVCQVAVAGQADEEKRLQQKYPAYRGLEEGYYHAGEAALDAWQDWKWGLRVHWGLYTLFGAGTESWVLVRPENTPEWRKNYFASYQQFNPVDFDPDEWMRVMERAGMKYFTVTTKHRERFCLWPTKTLQKGFRKTGDGKYEDVVDHYSIAETPYRRDILAQVAKAGRAHGVGVCFYYSHIDWHDWDFAWDKRNCWYSPEFTKESDPKRWAAFIQKEREQITELLTNYGPLGTLELDMGWLREARQDAYEVAKLARKLQPHVFLRNSGVGSYGDFSTPQGTIPEDPSQIRLPWQVIYPAGTGFSYKPNNQYRSKDWILESLIDVVAKGGNFQIGFGPYPKGRLPQEMIERVSYVGDCLRINGESIYATPSYFRYHEGNDLRFTRSKDKKFVYVISLKWPGQALKTSLVKAKPGSSVRMLGLKRDLKWSQDANVQASLRIQDRIGGLEP